MAGEWTGNLGRSGNIGMKGGGPPKRPVLGSTASAVSAPAGGACSAGGEPSSPSGGISRGPCDHFDHARADGMVLAVRRRLQNPGPVPHRTETDRRFASIGEGRGGDTGFPRPLPGPFCMQIFSLRVMRKSFCIVVDRVCVLLLSETCEEASSACRGGLRRCRATPAACRGDAVGRRPGLSAPATTRGHAEKVRPHADEVRPHWRGSPRDADRVYPAAMKGALHPRPTCCRPRVSPPESSPPSEGSPGWSWRRPRACPGATPAKDRGSGRQDLYSLLYIVRLPG